MRLTFRAYNEGAAFRYSFPAQNGARQFVFAAERTEFRFIPDTFGYEEQATEGSINGAIGKFATIARRSGEDWFIGAVNNSEPRNLKVPLAFLKKGVNYAAHIYSDDGAAATKTKVGVNDSACPMGREKLHFRSAECGMRLKG